MHRYNPEFDVQLTDKEQANLSDEELREIATHNAKKIGLNLSDGILRVGVKFGHAEGREG